MDTENNKSVRLDPEKFGIPQPKGDPMGMNQMITGMYRNLGEVNPSRPLWVKVFAIFLSVIALVLPGGFLLFIAFGFGLHFDNDSFQALIPLLFGFALFGAGIKIVYSNTRSIIKKHKV